MARKPSKDELRFMFGCRALDTLGSMWDSGVRYGSSVANFGFAYLIVRSLAGRHTFADIAISVLAGYRPSEIVAYVVAVIAVTYAQRQKRIRQDTIERTAKRLAELEGMIDPDRSSSRLTPRGDTAPGDRP